MPYLFGREENETVGSVGLRTGFYFLELHYFEGSQLEVALQVKFLWILGLGSSRAAHVSLQLLDEEGPPEIDVALA